MIHGLVINKKKYPFHLGIRAWKEYALEFQSNGSELKLDGLDDIYIIYLALKHGAKKEGEKFTLTPEGVEELLDNDIGAYMEAVKIITDFLPKVDVKKEVRPGAQAV